MATKIVKKKSPSKAAPKSAAATVESKVSPASEASAASAKQENSSVIPFSPVSGVLAGMTNPNLCQFNQPIPAMGEAFESMETAMNNFKNQYEKFTGDSTSAVRESVESCVQSCSTFAKGSEQMVKTIAEVAQESSQRNAEAIKALMASRTLNEFAEAQNKLAQQNFDDAMSTMTKLSEMAIKLYSEAFEPVNSQMTKAMSSAMKKNAA